MARFVCIFALLWFAVSLLPFAASGQTTRMIPTVPDFHVQLVGHNPLFNRGMNAALAMYDHFVYIGSRTDSSALCVEPTGKPAGSTCPHPHPGILIVDIKDPMNPAVVGEIAKPFAGNLGITTRELRVWPDKKLLIVMNFRCSLTLHACMNGTDDQFPFDISFFTLSDPLRPKFLSRYVPTSRSGRKVKPHEMYLWVDPTNADRALLYLSTPTDSKDPSLPNLIVADISRVSDGGNASEVAEGNWNQFYPGTNRPDYPLASRSPERCGPYDCNLYVHSMGISVDGTRAYLAMEAGQFLILDTSAVAKQTSNSSVVSLNNSLLTLPVNRPIWGQAPPDPHAVPKNCSKGCANGHSAVKIPGRPLVLTTDEVYGTYTDAAFGCPWGWEHLIDVSDEAHPKIVGEFKAPYDEQSFCTSSMDSAQVEQFTSFSSHNPTVLRDLALVTWHSGGFQVSDISDAAHPVRAGWFYPTPLDHVATEDPALSRGGSKVVMWSYPIVKDGLIYVVDVRNGLYILSYDGPHADEISHIQFLEGNSNLGDAPSLETIKPR